ncbi:MAG: site-2 protease family protein, partial [Opitutales bacterium]|nr:site-2 protease family protein [Opitutales bacterium]
MDLLSQIREGGILYILLLIAITMHEYGHALFADKLGDKLPRAEGRVTINPMAHIDTMGTVILPILTIALSMGSGFPMVFGWGKPVNVMLADP